MNDDPVTIPQTLHEASEAGKYAAPAGSTLFKSPRAAQLEEPGGDEDRWSVKPMLFQSLEAVSHD
ncbi:hypothetical protein GR243_30915 [Rhizobium leguminosarum]|nr:hypothetical protein [Rhizobium leguminosarum]